MPRSIPILLLAFVLLLAGAGTAPRSSAQPSDSTSRAAGSEIDARIGQIERLFDAADAVPDWERDGLSFHIDQRVLDLHAEIADLAEPPADSVPDGASPSPSRETLLRWMDRALGFSEARLEVIGRRIDEAQAEYSGFDNSPNAIISRAYVQDLRDVRFRHLRAMIDQLGQRKAMNLPDARAVREKLEEAIGLASQKLVGQIRLDALTLAELRERAVVDPSQDGLTAALGAVERKQSASLDLLRTLITLLDSLDEDTTELRALQAQQSGELGTELLDAAVLASVLRERIDSLKDAIAVDTPGMILRIAAFLLVLLLTWLVARLIRALVHGLTSHESVELGQLRERTIVSVSYGVVFLVGTVIALSTLGISLLPMLAGLGVASIIVGLALQESLGNLASGGMILLTRPFDLHDHVRIGDADGTVQDMNLMATSVSGFDSTLYIIPNRQVWNATILNFSRAEMRRVDLDFFLPYDVDVVAVEKVLQRILEEESRVLDKPPPLVRVGDLQENTLTVSVAAWVRNDQFDEVSTALKREVALHIQQAGAETG